MTEKASNEQSRKGLTPVGLGVMLGESMSPALQVMLNDGLFERVRYMAGVMSKAEGVTPKHLVNKPEACFAVIMRSITWKLDPFAVAGSTYQTPGGSIGYEGKLVQAIIENSGYLKPESGGVKFEHYGPWDQVMGKFEIKKSNKGNDYAARTWDRKDTRGPDGKKVGVCVRAHLRDEAKPRELNFDLEQAFPLNSTLWATDPKTQICYLAVRRFGTSVVPGLLMGTPFDRDEAEWAQGPDHAREVNPEARPTRTPPKGPVVDGEASRVVVDDPKPNDAQEQAAAQQDGGAQADEGGVAHVDESEDVPPGADMFVLLDAYGERIEGDFAVDEALRELKAQALGLQVVKAFDALMEHNEGAIKTIAGMVDPAAFARWQETITALRDSIVKANAPKKAEPKKADPQPAAVDSPATVESENPDPNAAKTTAAPPQESAPPERIPLGAREGAPVDWTAWFNEYADGVSKCDSDKQLDRFVKANEAGHKQLLALKAGWAKALDKKVEARRAAFRR